MKKIIITAAMTVAMATSAIAQSSNPWYLNNQGGYQENETSSGRIQRLLDEIPSASYQRAQVIKRVIQQEYDNGFRNGRVNVLEAVNSKLGILTSDYRPVPEACQDVRDRWGDEVAATTTNCENVILTRDTTSTVMGSYRSELQPIIDYLVGVGLGNIDRTDIDEALSNDNIAGVVVTDEDVVSIREEVNRRIALGDEG